MAATLVVNPGSSSRKYALYGGDSPLLEVRYESTQAGFEKCTRLLGKQPVCEAVSEKEFALSFQHAACLAEEELKRRFPDKNLTRVVVRVVAPGSYFQEHRLVDKEYLKRLESNLASAPLHTPIALREIKAVRAVYKDIAIIAASDSAFHKEMPMRAREYSIAREDADKYDLHRFGYHGLSVSSVVRRIHNLAGGFPERLIVCHIGNGVSVTSVLKGKSVETTMGFAPASGLPMGSRAGDVDNTVLFELMKKHHWSAADAETYVNSRGGLVGLAGDSDIRILLERRAKGDEVAVNALNTFAYHIKKAIAAGMVALEGLDVLVLTATAAVRSSELRTLLLQNMSQFGIKLSAERNESITGREGVISPRNSLIKVIVMRTDEMGEMARVGKQMTEDGNNG